MRKYFLGGLWLLSLAAISFYGGPVSYGFFFGVTLIPVISLIYLLCVYCRFKIYQETEKRNLVCGQPAPYFFVLQNDDRFAYTGIRVRMHSVFSYAEDSFDNTEYDLLPKDSAVCETRLVCKYRGEYEIGVKEVVLTDFFRLFRLRYTVSGQIKASVSPRIVLLSELKSIADLPMILQKDISSDTEPDIPVRDYGEGDSLKQIHWKATAREGKLKVRVTTGKENQNISVFCDTRRYSRDRKEYLPLENKMLEVFLAVGRFLAGLDREFCAYYGQAKVIRKKVRGVKEFEDFYQDVSRICFDEGEDLLKVLEQVILQGALWGCGLVFLIVHTLSPASLDATKRLSASGVIVVIYVVTEEELQEYERWGSLRRRIVVIPTEADLEGRL